MNTSRAKIIAILTGFISVLICILYLLLITIFDFRSFLNEHFVNHSENMAIVWLEIDYDP